MKPHHLCLKCLHKLLDFHKFRDNFCTNVKFYAIEIKIETDPSSIKDEVASLIGNDSDVDDVDDIDSMEYDSTETPANIEQHMIRADPVEEIVEVKLEIDDHRSIVGLAETSNENSLDSLEPNIPKNPKSKSRGKNSVERKAKKDYFCDACGRTFNTTYYQFTYHQRIHDPNSPFVCKYCGKRFPVPNDLHKHQKIHTGEKPFVCHICGHRSASEYLEKVRTLFDCQ